MKELETKFWRLSTKIEKIRKKRLSAIKKWNVPELERLDAEILHNQQQGDLIIDRLKELSIQLTT